MNNKEVVTKGSKSLLLTVRFPLLREWKNFNFVQLLDGKPLYTPPRANDLPTVTVSRLSSRCGEADLRNYFGRCGEVVGVKLLQWGNAEIHFDDIHGARNALHFYDGISFLDECPIAVSSASSSDLSAAPCSGGGNSSRSMQPSPGAVYRSRSRSGGENSTRSMQPSQGAVYRSRSRSRSRDRGYRGSRPERGRFVRSDERIPRSGGGGNGGGRLRRGRCPW